MVTDFSGSLIFSNEFVVIGMASTDNLGGLWVCAPNAAHVARGHRWQTVAQKPKSERDDKELVSFHN